MRISLAVSKFDVDAPRLKYDQNRPAGTQDKCGDFPSCSTLGDINTQNIDRPLFICKNEFANRETR